MTFDILEPGYKKDMENGLRHENRDKYYKRLTPDEKKLVDMANEQGKGVRWRDEQSNHMFTFVPKEEQRQKAAAKEAQQVEEEKKGGFWSRNSWLKWTLGALALVGAGIGAYFLLKKDKKGKNNPSPKTPTKTETKDPTPAKPSGQKIAAPAIINSGDELGNGSSGVDVTSGLTVNSSTGAGSAGVETTPRSGVVSSGLTVNGRRTSLGSTLSVAGSRFNTDNPNVTNGEVTSGLSSGRYC